MIRILGFMRERVTCHFAHVTIFKEMSYGDMVFFEVSYSVCVKIRFSGHILGFAYTSLRSLLSSEKSRLGNLDFFFVF